jgi:hypothetical protein
VTALARFAGRCAQLGAAWALTIALGRWRGAVIVPPVAPLADAMERADDFTHNRPLT